MKKRSIFVVLATIVALCTFSQNETNKWYFGTFAGLDFNTQPPTPLSNSAMHAWGGSASVSDSSGNLLFYTNGIMIYNKNHTAMDNGSNIGGLSGAMGNGLTVKKPGSQDLYYVFSIGSSSTGVTLQYSIVDMALASGLGSVTAKSVRVFEPVDDKLAATKHCNGVDVWVVCHENATNVFRSFLITSSGVNTVAVTSTLGVAQSTSAPNSGEMKFSPDGKKLAVAWFKSNFELFDFDPSTGVVSNHLALCTNYFDNFGCAFSPDGSRFYGSRFGVSGVGSLNGAQLIQWNLCAGSPSAIVASQYTLSMPSTNSPGDQCAGMQLAPDGKIYVSSLYTQSLSVINNPNGIGASCSYSSLAVPIQPGYVAYTLPSNVEEHPIPAPPAFTWTASCQTVSFTPPPGYIASASCSYSPKAALSAMWLFGDGSSASSSDPNPQFVYPGPGTYNAKLHLYYQCHNETIEVPVTITHTAPIITVTGNTEVCNGEAVTLTASGASGYIWNGASGTNSISFVPASSGLYTVTGASGSTVCPTTSTVLAITVNDCTALTEQEYKTLGVYPNPFTDKLVIGTSTAARLKIYDISGKQVLSCQVSGERQEIDTGALEPGIYFLHFQSGRRIEVMKVIKISDQ